MPATVASLRPTLSVRAVGAFLLLGGAWILSTPPGGGVDESSHYVRTIGLSRGQLIGDDVDALRPFEGFQDQQLRRINAESGWFTIPARMPPPNDCNVLDATRPYDCPAHVLDPGTTETISLHGRSLPGAYVVPAIVSRFATGTYSATVLSRVGMLLQNVVLFGILLVALKTAWSASAARSRSDWLPGAALLGLSLTPVLIFLASTMSPSSFETISVATFSASLIAAARTRSTRWLALVVALSVAASWSRDLGAVAVVIAAVAIGVVEPDLRQWWQSSTRRRWLPIGIGGLGVVSALLWQALLKYPLQPEIGSLSQLWSDIAVVFRTLRQGIGLGGWLNTPLDPILETFWFVGLIAVVTMLLTRASSLVRRVLFFQFIVVIGVSLYLVAMLRQAGFGIQARFFMPLLASMVIILVTSPGHSESSVVSPFRRYRWRAFVSFLAFAHGSLLLISAHRHARGLNGTPIDFGSSQWSPPGGWGLPAVLGVLGVAMVASLPRPNLGIDSCDR